MRSFLSAIICTACVCASPALSQNSTASTNRSITIAAFNVENYLHAPSGTRKAKGDEARAKIRECIHTINPDVISFSEMGQTNALLELRSSLKSEGLDYPHWAHVSGFDTNIFVAVLSRLPIAANRSHTNASFLLNGRRFRTSRGIAELEIQATKDYSFTLFGAHLKSKRPIGEADQADVREQEALALREIINARLKSNPNANIVVLSDLNDTKDSRPVRTIIGRGNNALIDTRPAERNGDNIPSPIRSYAPRNVAWTYFYGKEDVYERIDYILISRGMAREWNTNGTYVLSVPNWGAASDHRPVVASFFAQDR